MKSAVNYKLINIALFLITIFFIYQTKMLWLNIFHIIINIIRPFLIAFIISYLFYPLIKLLSKKINKKLSTIIVITITILIIVILLKITIPLVYREIPILLKELTLFIDHLSLKYNTSIIDILTNNLNNIISTINNYLNNDLLPIVSKSISIVLEVMMISILTIYFLFNYDDLRNAISTYFIKKNQKIYYLLRNIDQQLSSYITGIGIIMLIELIEYTMIYYAIGHPNFFLLAVLASFTTIIPFFGGLVTNIIALITASVISPKLFLLTSLVIVLMPLIDGYLIQPKIYKKTNSLPPMLTIIIVILGSMLFKVIGVMIAIPLYIVIKNIIVFHKKNTFIDI